ncbi:unnamed protein product [Brassica oleracea var. botrytis]
MSRGITSLKNSWTKLLHRLESRGKPFKKACVCCCLSELTRLMVT